MKRIQNSLIVATALLLPSVLSMPAQADEPGQQPWDGAHVLIDASSGLVNRIVRRPVDRTEPISETILETPVRGMGQTRGTVYALLIPDKKQATVDIVLDATVHSETVATRCCVLINTAGTTTLDIHRRVIIDCKGLRACPGPVHARATTKLMGITTLKGETDTTATTFNTLGFGQKKEAGEAESAGKAARRSAERLAEELTPSLAKASQSVGQGLAAIKQMGLTVESLDFSTTPAILQARMKVATPGRGQPGSSQHLPADADLGIRIHEALINEAAQARLGGKTILLTGAKKSYEGVLLGLLMDGRKESDTKLALKVLETLLAKMEKTTASITLAEKDPLTFAFADQGFVVELHIASIHSGGVLYQGMRARAVYRLENSKEGAHAVRKDPVQFLPAVAPTAAEKKLEPQPVAFVLLRDLVFAEIFKQRFTLAPLALPESAANVSLLPPRADARNGWLALAWKLQ